MRRLLHAALLVLLVGASACAAGSARNTEPTSRRDLITRADIEGTQWQNAFDVVRALRPQWLQVRGRDTITGDPVGVQVVLDGVRLGGVDALRNFSVGGIGYLQYFDAISASQRWGTGFGQGAIFISSTAR